MKAAIYDEFEGPLSVREVAEPSPSANAAVLRVAATGICRSDWHGWKGHDPDIRPPQVPGHEMAGTVAALGSGVCKFQVNDRVTVPFVCGCGACHYCTAGQQQVCPHQTQPGFTHWGSYAEYVLIENADTNLVPLDDRIDFVTAASLGCRFATAFRAVVSQGRASPGETVAVHGCGGVGLSAIMIAAAYSARVIAVDIDSERLALARELGAATTVDARSDRDTVAAIRQASDGGADLSLDALGSLDTCRNSIDCLKRRGRHVQVGLMVGDYRSPPLPMDRVVAHELEILGSHGMQAHAYGPMLQMVLNGKLDPARLVLQRITLEQATAGFADERYLRGAGVTVIDRFS